MRDKIISEYFNKKADLTIKNKQYRQFLTALITLLAESDDIKDDRSSNIISRLLNRKTWEAKIVSGESGILAGTEEVDYFLNQKSDIELKPLKKDGQEFRYGDIIAEVRGSTLSILAFERTILNVLQRMSGIATFTTYLIKKYNFKNIAATRKTFWGLFDKKAVALGGGLTHRLSLSDEILIKDNHVDLTGKDRKEGFMKIIDSILQNSISDPFEIEVKSEKEAFFVANYYLTDKLTFSLILMLDNFTPTTAKKTIRSLRNLEKKFKKIIIIELSGGINESNLKEFIACRPDVISMSLLTTSPKPIDFTLTW